MRLKFALLPVAVFALALGGCDKQSGESAQGTDNEVTSGEVAPDEVTADEATPDEAAATGEGNVGGETFKHVIDRSHKGEAMPAVGFLDPAGKPTTLAREAAGKPLAVNLWATWCAPCVAELPALDTLASTAAGKGVKVIAVSQDQGGAEIVEPFLAKRNLSNLKRYLDAETGLGFAYGTSLPTTVFYDKAGKEVLRVIGALDWAGADGAALLKEIGG